MRNAERLHQRSSTLRSRLCKNQNKITTVRTNCKRKNQAYEKHLTQIENKNFFYKKKI